MRKALSVFTILIGVLFHAVSISAEPKPTVYLTFDDGPSDVYTALILDKLAEHGAVATFFVTGVRVDANPGMLARIHQEGHAVANHTQNHANLRKLSKDGILNELISVQVKVESLTGSSPVCYRPPYGFVNQTVRDVANTFPLDEWLWTVDTNDWRWGKDSITEELNKIEDQSIVLMHDGPGDRPETWAAFSEWMDVNAHKFRFAPLPGCEGTVPDIPYDTDTPDEWYVFRSARYRHVITAGHFTGFPTDGKTLLLQGLPTSKVYSTEGAFPDDFSSSLNEFWNNAYSRDITSSEEAYWKAAILLITPSEFVSYHSESAEILTIFPSIKGCGNRLEPYLCLKDKLAPSSH